MLIVCELRIWITFFPSVELLNLYLSFLFFSTFLSECTRWAYFTIPIVLCRIYCIYCIYCTKCTILYPISSEKLPKRRKKNSMARVLRWGMTVEYRLQTRAFVRWARIYVSTMCRLIKPKRAFDSWFWFWFWFWFWLISSGTWPVRVFWWGWWVSVMVFGRFLWVSAALVEVLL